MTHEIAVLDPCWRPSEPCRLSSSFRLTSCAAKIFAISVPFSNMRNMSLQNRPLPLGNTLTGDHCVVLRAVTFSQNLQ